MKTFQSALQTIDISNNCIYIPVDVWSVGPWGGGKDLLLGGLVRRVGWTLHGE